MIVEQLPSTTHPCYGTSVYWQQIEAPAPGEALPLEVLVRCAREASARADDESRNRIIEVIFRRTQSTNEYWAHSILNQGNIPTEERHALMADLYADLCECVIRAILDPQRLFWEENFLHCLSFERKHVYHAFTRREGLRANPRVKQSERIPRSVLSRLDQPVTYANGEFGELAIEDERAQHALLAVDHADLPQLVVQLPNKLKAVILLLFWEGRTEKDTATLLGITDRTVRHRRRQALGILHNKLEPERERVHG